MDVKLRYWGIAAAAGLGLLQSTLAAADRQRQEDAVTAVDAPTDAAANRAIAERAARLLEERYVVRATGARYARSLRHHARRGDYASIAEVSLLAERMTADLQKVQPDGHVHLYKVDPPAPGSEPTFDAPAAAEASRTVPGIREMKWLEPGVAYLSFEHFDDRPVALNAISRFLVNYSAARALIIDSRQNHGGAFDMLGLLANHLFATRRHLADMDMANAVVQEYGSPFHVDGSTLVQVPGPPGMERFQHWAVPAQENRAWFQVPVYYLTSRETYSAAEHMAMVFKTTRRATLIGEATGGGNHFGGTEPVGGGLELFVPVGHTTDPATGRDWERVGIAPDIAVPAEDALDAALGIIHGVHSAKF